MADTPKSYHKIADIVEIHRAKLTITANRI